jgi:predicted membrane protein
MSEHGGSSGRIFWGIFLILIGVLFLLDRMGRFDFGYAVSHYWPAIFIAIGLSIWLGSGFRDFVSGLLFVAFGTVFLLVRLNVLGHHFWNYFWPLLIIFAGLWVLLHPAFHHRTRSFPEIKEGDLNISAVFSGVNRRIESQSFKGGYASAVFGSVELDFTAAALAEGKASVELSAVLGNVEVTVPGDWQVVIDGTPILGAIDNKHRTVAPSESKGTLYVKATAVFGSVLVKD